jgi:hypothetical protein
MMQKVSVAVTWIAVKIEEQTHKIGLRDLVMIYNILQQREEGLSKVHVEPVDSERFRRVQEELATEYEMAVFKALGFICHVDHPHKFMTNLLGYIFYDAAHGKSEVPAGLVQVCANSTRIACLTGMRCIVLISGIIRIRLIATLKMVGQIADGSVHHWQALLLCESCIPFLTRPARMCYSATSVMCQSSQGSCICCTMLSCKAMLKAHVIL